MHPAGLEVRLLEDAFDLVALPLRQGIPLVEIDEDLLVLSRIPAGHDRVLDDLLERHVVDAARVPIGAFDRAELEGGINFARVHRHWRAAHRGVENRLRPAGAHLFAREVLQTLYAELGEHGVRTLIGPTDPMQIALVRGFLDQIADPVLRITPPPLPGIFGTVRAQRQAIGQHAFWHFAAIYGRPTRVAIRLTGCGGSKRFRSTRQGTRR